MALIAAWKASSSEVSDGFSVVFGFDVEGRGLECSGGLMLFGDSSNLDDRFGFDGSDGSDGSIDSTVSSHGFVFAAFIRACCFGFGGSL